MDERTSSESEELEDELAGLSWLAFLELCTLLPVTGGVEGDRLLDLEEHKFLFWRKSCILSELKLAEQLIIILELLIPPFFMAGDGWETSMMYRC